MKAFRFPLDRALHIRRAQLEIERAKLGQLTREGDLLDSKALTLITEAADVRRGIPSGAGLTGGEISTVPDYQRRSRLQLVKLDLQKQDLIKRLEERRRQTMEAERRVKLLEELRRKRLAEWQTQAQKEQEDFAADAYLARWNSSH